MSETRDRGAAGRLTRLLALVPWVLAHPEPTVAEVCVRFDVSRQELVADLELLFVAGIPPYGPGDLIEAWVEEDRVHIAVADYFARAPRLTWREAAGLYLAGRALAALPGVDESGALASALAKLEAVLPGDQLAQVQAVAGRVSVDLEGDAVEAANRAVIARAVAGLRRVQLEYYTGSRHELTTRTVDPWLLFAASGHWYLAGWCHLARGERLFRLDRVLSARPTEESFTPPEGLDPAAYRTAPRLEPAEGVVCHLDLGPEAEWVAEYFPVESAERGPGGRLRVGLRASSIAWVVRLVLRLAPYAEPVSPPELRRQVADAAAQQLARYG